MIPPSYARGVKRGNATKNGGLRSPELPGTQALNTVWKYNLKARRNITRNREGAVPMEHHTHDNRWPDFLVMTGCRSFVIQDEMGGIAC
jgi:hypothetical protein